MDWPSFATTATDLASPKSTFITIRGLDKPDKISERLCCMRHRAGNVDDSIAVADSLQGSVGAYQEDSDGEITAIDTSIV